MNPTLYRLTPVQPPQPELAPGVYVFADGEDRIEINLHRPIRPRQLAALLRDLPMAGDVAA